MLRWSSTPAVLPPPIPVKHTTYAKEPMRLAASDTSAGFSEPPPPLARCAISSVAQTSLRSPAGGLPVPVSSYRTCLPARVGRARSRCVSSAKPGGALAWVTHHCVVVPAILPCCVSCARAYSPPVRILPAAVYGKLVLRAPLAIPPCAALRSTLFTFSVLRSGYRLLAVRLLTALPMGTPPFFTLSRAKIRLCVRPSFRLVDAPRRNLHPPPPT
jgi:hypothetical protein